MTSSGVALPSLLSIWATTFVAVFGLMGTVFKTVLDHNYGLPAALFGTAVVGVVAAGLAAWLLARMPFQAGPNGPQPPLPA